MSNHNLCCCFFFQNKKNNVYPCKPQFYYIKVGFKGIKIILACFLRWGMPVMNYSLPEAPKEEERRNKQ